MLSLADREKSFVDAVLRNARVEDWGYSSSEEISLEMAAQQSKSTAPAMKTRVIPGLLKLAAALRHSPAQSLVHAA